MSGRRFIRKERKTINVIREKEKSICKCTDEDERSWKVEEVGTKQ